MTIPTVPLAPPPPLFSLAIDPRDRLLLFDIADDPTYVAMEIQAFDDALHGRGVLVLLARHDGIVDVHRQPGLRLERGPFSIGRGIGEWREAEIDPARLDIRPDGVDVEVALDDAEGRRISIRINDRDGIARSRSTLLAPVGSGVEKPGQFFVVLMRDFDLGRTSGIEPQLEIGGVPRTVRPFPGPAWLHRRRFIRYSGDPIIAILNPAHDGPVDPASLGPVAAVTIADGEKHAGLRFQPQIPDLRTMPPGATAAGGWWLDVGDESGLTGGDWSASRVGDVIELDLAVTQPWRPRSLPIALRFVTTVARVFREWPTTYRWTARLDLAADQPVLRSGWARTTGPVAENPYGLRAQSLGAGARAAGAALGLLGLALAMRRLAGRRRMRTPAETRPASMAGS